MKIDVFGASGFIGSNFVTQSRFDTVSISRDSTISSSEQILYLIGTTDNYNVFEDPLLDIETNLILLIKVLEDFRKKNSTATFNFVSSWFVYGKGIPPFLESDNCEPRGFYSITKFSAELLLESFCKTFKLNYRIIRLANVYGEGDKGMSKKKNALQYMIYQLKKDEKVELYENGDIVRDFIHVDDVVNAFDLILTQGIVNEIYNVGTGIPVKISELVLNARNIIGSKSVISNIETPEFHQLVQTKDAWLDIEKVKNLGFTHQSDIRKDLEKLCL